MCIHSEMSKIYFFISSIPKCKILFIGISRLLNNTNLYVSQEVKDLTWRVSDCAELVEVTHRRYWKYYVTIKWNFLRIEQRVVWFKIVYFYQEQIYNNN